MPKKNKTVIPLCKLRPFFGKPMLEASKQLRTCLTVIKSSCRAHGILRWPYPEIQRITRTMKYLEGILDLDSQGVISLGDEERYKYENRYRKLKEHRHQLELHPECINLEWKADGKEFEQHLEQVSDSNTDSYEKDVTWSCSSESRKDRMNQILVTRKQLNDISPSPTSHQLKEGSSTILSQTQQQIDPCFLFLNFILRIGSQGVREMGPELITEMAKVVVPSMDFNHLTNINEHAKTIESIQSKLMALQVKIAELKNQNERLFQLLKDTKSS
ncbi:hypothetical protein GpartN1_g2789.t1 [Galdieria partita]|uniref:RWP-RK domain-containing protein n=1 Tax=Galdieria partita TaxID=83374 RepID=A0A9C7PUB9_9RHOD|nr:hypothetical protein GpartN1_g2789.t1 [Galdieria partita]